jgi:type I restriction enzyme, S subunit
MKLKKYPKYKNSGVQWIGEIPEEWKIQRGKFQFKVTGGYAFPSDAFVEDGISLVRIGDISEGTVHLKECKKMPEDYSLTKKEFLLNEKEVLVAMTGATIGKVGQVPKTNEKMLLNQRVGRIKTKHSSDYYKYVLTADFIKEQIRLIAEGAAQENISSEQIESFVIPQLDKSNQTQIASFLDTKTQNISKTIEKDKKLIELLKEKRIALINHVVTKGLDKNTKMKESGVDWIGKIPEGWKVWKLAHCFDIIGSGTTPSASDDRYFAIDDEKGIDWVITGDLNDSILFSSSKKITRKALQDFSALKIFPKGSLVIAMYGATIGKTTMTNMRSTFNQACCVLNNSKQLIIKYAHYWFIAKKKEIVALGYGGGQPNISQDVIKRLKITVPDKSDQLQIIQYLDKQTKRIDQTINKIQEKITLMQEYKKSLIHHVVTGKVDVRGVEA